MSLGIDGSTLSDVSKDKLNVVYTISTTTERTDVTKWTDVIAKARLNAVQSFYIQNFKV